MRGGRRSSLPHCLCILALASVSLSGCSALRPVRELQEAVGKSSNTISRNTEAIQLLKIVGDPTDIRGADYLILDASSIRNLELLESAGAGSNKDTLLGVIDRTATGMGARLLRRGRTPIWMNAHGDMGVGGAPRWVGAFR